MLLSYEIYDIIPSMIQIPLFFLRGFILNPQNPFQKVCFIIENTLDSLLTTITTSSLLSFLEVLYSVRMFSLTHYIKPLLSFPRRPTESPD